MHHVVNWFEIPVKDMARAKQFYSNVLPTQFLDEEADGMQMAVFEHADDAVSGMLVKAEHFEPNATGTAVYLNGGKDLAEPLQRAVENGAQILVPKMGLDDGAKGYFAQFLDSEGNRVGLYSAPVAD